MSLCYISDWVTCMFECFHRQKQSPLMFFLSVQTAVGFTGPSAVDASPFSDLDQLRNLTNKSISGIGVFGSPITSLFVQYGYGDEGFSVLHGDETTAVVDLACYPTGQIITTIDVYADSDHLYGIQFHLGDGTSCPFFGTMDGAKQTPVEASDLKYISGNASSSSIVTLEFHFTKETGTSWCKIY